MTYTVEVKHVASQPLAVVRRQARLQDLSKVVPDACGVVWNCVKALGFKAGRHVAIYYDGQINLEVGVEIADSFTGSGDVIGSATPAGRVVTTAHIGPYKGLGDAHQAIRDWAGQHQETLAGPNWEIYDHWNDNPSELRTDVFYLLKGS